MSHPGECKQRFEGELIRRKRPPELDWEKAKRPMKTQEVNPSMSSQYLISSEEQQECERISRSFSQRLEVFLEPFFSALPPLLPFVIPSKDSV
jgi:hypothetical protein